MIPRRIHWVHLGPPSDRPEVPRCIESVKRLHPDFQFYVHSDASIFALSCFHQLRPELHSYYDALAHCDRPYPRRADLLRMCIVYALGGIALDQDMYGVRPLHRFLFEPILLGRLGQIEITEAILGAPPCSRPIRDLLLHYLAQPVGFYPLMWQPAQAQRWKVYPADYFCPWRRGEPRRLTPNTHTCHLWHGDPNEDIEQWIRKQMSPKH